MYSYKFRNKIENNRIKDYLLIFFAGMISIVASWLTITGFRLNSIDVGYSIFIPFFVLFSMLIITMMLLYKNRYRGTLVPLAALVILMGIGSVYQIRMNTALNEGHNQGQNYKQISMLENSLNKQSLVLSTTYLLSIAGLVLSISMFSGRRFNRLSRKYMLLFASTIAGIGILVLLSKIFDGGKFLFSRVPWELAKILIPVSIAGFLAKYGRYMTPISNRNKMFGVWLPFITIVFIPLSMFVMLGDLGQVMFYVFVLYILLYLATDSIIYPLAGFVFVLMLPLITSMVVPYLPEYVGLRLELWSDLWGGFPAADWWDKSYQTINGFFAMKAGSVFGTGLGNGNPDLVPLAVSDFAITGLAEELGFIGTLTIYLLYLCIILTGIKTAFTCEKRFDFLAVSGLSLVLFVQIFINIGGVINYIPLTGVVLPFISKGGFSLITFCSITGIIMAISHKNEKLSKIKI